MSASQPNLKTDADVVAIQPEANKLTAFARAVVVKTAEQYASAGSYLKSVKGLLKQIDDAHARVKQPLLRACKELDTQKREAAAPLLMAEGQLKRAMIAFDDEQDRIRREEQVRANEQARRQQEKLQQQAAKATQAGRVERAMELETRAAAVVAPAIQREPTKVDGIGNRLNWHAECNDLLALAKAVVEGRAPVSYVMANDKVLGQQARSLKQDFVCDGVRVWADKNIAAGGAA